MFNLGGKMSRSLLLLSAGLILLATACDRDPAGSGGLFLPPPGYVADAARGKALFEQHCAQCHGMGGRGTNQGPPLVHRIYEPGHHSDMAFYMAVKQGVRAHHWQFGNMPPREGVSAEEVADIIAYVRREQRRAGIN